MLAENLRSVLLHGSGKMHMRWYDDVFAEGLFLRAIFVIRGAHAEKPLASFPYLPQVS